MDHLHLPRILFTLSRAVKRKGVDDLAPGLLVEPTSE